MLHLEVQGWLDLAQLAQRFPTRYPFLLESVAHGTSQGRYDILFAHPGACLRLDGAGHLTGPLDVPPGTDFLTALDTAYLRERMAPSSDRLPFRGGWFVYLGYELSSQIESRLGALRGDAQDTIAFATRIPAAIIRDHTRRRMYLVAEAGHAALIDAMQRDLQQANGAEDVAPDATALAVTEDDPALFLSSVARILRYITAGDVFQVNLSRAWRAHLPKTVRPVDLYRRLRSANPAPFAGFVQYPNLTLLSSSPERLVRVEGDVVETRPIAGTRPRGVGDADQRMRKELLNNAKERSEHIMLIDLERNDLGRICRPGTVRVDELMGLETYTHVHHIVSNVTGRLRADVTPGQVIRAVFPGGTITGCPKVRCMEIIAELEQQPRGAYTGSMGYINRDGGMDFNILIRTITLRSDHLELRAGAGIVADSVAERELEETRAKARGLLAALGVAALGE